MNGNLRKFWSAGYWVAVALAIFVAWFLLENIERPGRAEIDFLRASFKACYENVLAVQRSDSPLRAFPDCITNLDLYQIGKTRIEFTHISDVDKIATNTVLCRSANGFAGRYMLLLGNGEITWTDKHNR